MHLWLLHTPLPSGACQHLRAPCPVPRSAVPQHKSTQKKRHSTKGYNEVRRHVRPGDSLFPMQAACLKQTLTSHALTMQSTYQGPTITFCIEGNVHVLAMCVITGSCTQGEALMGSVPPCLDHVG